MLAKKSYRNCFLWLRGNWNFCKTCRSLCNSSLRVRQQKAALCPFRNVFFLGGFILSKQLNHTAAAAVGDATTQMDGQVSSYGSIECKKIRNITSETHLPLHLLVLNVVQRLPAAHSIAKFSERFLQHTMEGSTQVNNSFWKSFFFISSKSYIAKTRQILGEKRKILICRK